MKRRKTYTIDDLSMRTGLPPRTIRYYIAKGIVPHAKRQGKYGGYSTHHVKCIKRFVVLKSRNRTLDQIAEKMRAEGLV